MYQRHITSRLFEALQDTPVVALHGARQTGKSTLAGNLACGAYQAQYFTMDDIGTLSAARQDPAGFLSGISGPVILDEIQRAPELLLAIKAEVDHNRAPGRFLLTGSAHVLNLPRIADTLAGRMETLVLMPLSQGEISGTREGFIDALFDEKLPTVPFTGTEIRDQLLERIVTGGYPEVITRKMPDRRKAWFDSYLNAVLYRDLRDISNISGLAEIPRLAAVMAGRAGGVINYADLARDSGLNQMTLKRYFSLLQCTFIVRTVSPWFTSRIKRVIKAPKLYFGDTGLLSHLLGVHSSASARDSKSLGAMFENFVALELIKQIPWSVIKPELFHFRNHAGHEVDFLLETPGGEKYAGIEVKAGATVGQDDFKGLRILSETLGKCFVRGVVLYSGTGIIPFGRNLHAVPMSALWT
ncbi:MAG: ATP-binding protein [Candidatus Wallbacteria bacterium]|nr:ATP-binding protein [Candidatus Wallbacteria bacterium]